MSQASMHLDLLHSLNVLSDLGIEGVGGDVHIVTLTIVLLSVNVPGGDSVGKRIGDHLTELVPLLLADFSGSLGQIDFGDLTEKVRKTTSYTLNGGE